MPLARIARTSRSKTHDASARLPILGLTRRGRILVSKPSAFFGDSALAFGCLVFGYDVCGSADHCGGCKADRYSFGVARARGFCNSAGKRTRTDAEQHAVPSRR